MTIDCIASLLLMTILTAAVLAINANRHKSQKPRRHEKQRRRWGATFPKKGAAAPERSEETDNHIVRDCPLGRRVAIDNIDIFGNRAEGIAQGYSYDVVRGRDEVVGVTVELEDGTWKTVRMLK